MGVITNPWFDINYVIKRGSQCFIYTKQDFIGTMWFEKPDTPFLSFIIEQARGVKQTPNGASRDEINGWLMVQSSLIIGILC